MLNLSLLPLVLIGVLIGCGGEKNPESTPKDGNGTPKAQGSDNKEATLAEYLPGKRFEYGMSDQMKEAAAKAQNTSCQFTMNHLETLIELWALKNKKKDSDKVTFEDLASASIIKSPPTCPAGGKYILTTVGEGPKCSHGHSRDHKQGDKLPPFGGPPMRGVLQFNEDGTVLMGEINEAGVAERRSPAMTYMVTGPMEISLGQTGTDGGKMMFTSINPAEGDGFTFVVLLGEEEKEVFSNTPITGVESASPLKDPEPEPESEPPGEEPSEF
tara:strand:- start:2238 stop:3050 length:813 start_codon:yes stop_codon:yes gene_type:complete